MQQIDHKLNSFIELLWIYFESHAYSDIVIITISEIKKLVNKSGYPIDKFDILHKKLIENEYLYKDYIYLDDEYIKLGENERVINAKKVFYHFISEIPKNENIAKRFLKKYIKIFERNEWNFKNTEIAIEQLTWEYNKIKEIEIYSFDDKEAEELNLPTFDDMLFYTKKGFCYTNAINIMKKYSEDIQYIEGYLYYDGHVFSHAWNKFDNKYFDATAEAHLEIEEDTKYFSVIELNKQMVLNILLFIDSPSNGLINFYYQKMIKNTI
jgi:hypothetical protein